MGFTYMCNREVLIGFLNPPLLFLLRSHHVIQAFRVLCQSDSLSLRAFGCLGQSNESKGV